MIDNAKNPIKQAVPARRDAACFELQHAILIPKGTILRQDIGGVFSCPVGRGMFTVEPDVAGTHPSTFRRVIA